MAYRITNPEPGLFAPAVRKGKWPLRRWVSLDDCGIELPMGHRWSGPLGCAVNAITTHGQIRDVEVRSFKQVLTKSGEAEG